MLPVERLTISFTVRVSFRVRVKVSNGLESRLSHLSVVSWVGLTVFIVLNQLSLSDAHSGRMLFFLHVVF